MQTLLKADQQLITDLQSVGLRLTDPTEGAASRRGGAGPSDHKAVTVNGHTVMIPVHTASSWSSPFVAAPLDASGNSTVCLLYTSPSPRDQRGSRMPSSA